MEPELSIESVQEESSEYKSFKSASTKIDSIQDSNDYEMC